ncbi:MAG: hypothetical protein R2688_09270 [Fimbriimonadaceae bacterium]
MEGQEQKLFDGTEKTKRTPFIEEQELHDLLTRLHAAGQEEVTHEKSDDDHYATAEAVSEVTGESVDHVLDVLEKIRDENVRARIATNIREAEEVLYRVERNDTRNRDPLSSRKPIVDGSTVTTILDKIKNDQKLSGYRRFRPAPETKDEAALRWLVLIIVAGIVVISFAAIFMNFFR